MEGMASGVSGHFVSLPFLDLSHLLFQGTQIRTHISVMPPLLPRLALVLQVLDLNLRLQTHLHLLS